MQYNSFNTQPTFFQKLRNFDQAILQYKKAINYKNLYLDAYINLANLFKEIKQFEEAIKNYDLAINLNPNLAEVYNNKGNALKEIRNFEEAIKNYDLAINLNPNFAEAYFNAATALQDIKNFEKAVLYFEKALLLDKEIPFCKGYLLHAKMLCCNWSGLNELYKEILHQINLSSPRFLGDFPKQPLGLLYFYLHFQNLNALKKKLFY